jgi:hypothetical protein
MAQEEFCVVTQKQPLFEIECEIYGPKIGKNLMKLHFSV